MKIVKLQGGLGNQMFQYAFGQALSYTFGEQVLFDKSWFFEAQKQTIGDTGRNKDGICMRHHELYIFANMPIKYATEKDVEKTRKSNLPYLVRNLLKTPKYPYHFVEKNAFQYDSTLLFPYKKAYYEGYFQNEKYFSFLRNKLVNWFQLPPLKSQDVYNRSLLRTIQQTPNPVFIHVRREDYIKLNWLVSLSYYRNAVQYILSQVTNPTFFVFCAEEPEYIKQQFNIGVPFKLIGELNRTQENFYENMRLMMACRHAIIANSTYSWWAAWLSDQTNKIVTAPDPWVNGQNEIISHNWIRIANK